MFILLETCDVNGCDWTRGIWFWKWRDVVAVGAWFVLLDLCGVCPRGRTATFPIPCGCHGLPGLILQPSCIPSKQEDWADNIAGHHFGIAIGHYYETGKGLQYFSGGPTILRPAICQDNGSELTHGCWYFQVAEICFSSSFCSKLSLQLQIFFPFWFG